MHDPVVISQPVTQGSGFAQELRRQVFKLHHVAFTGPNGVLDHILQFPDISRPPVMSKYIQHFR